jgi:adenylate kinase family enzyme
MSKYNNGKIYKLTSSQTDKVYIGSTIKSLDVRFSNHKYDYKRRNNKYITSCDLLQYDDVKIELIKEFPCNTRKELEKEEGKLILENNCVNKCVAGRTKKEWDDDNKDKIKEYFKEYYQENKEKIKERHKEYRDDNNERVKEKFKCDCGGDYSYAHKSRHFKTKKHLKFVNQV